MFVAHELDGRSSREMAVETGVNVNTLLSRKRYAVRHLRARRAFTTNSRNDEDLEHEKATARHGSAGDPGIVLFAFLGGQAVRLLWNWLLPTLFGWPQITFWQALGLLALSRILFGGSGGDGSGRSRFGRDPRGAAAIPPRHAWTVGRRLIDGRRQVPRAAQRDYLTT